MTSVLDDLALDIDSDPARYALAQEIVDESVSDAMLDQRERDVRTRVREVVARDVAPRSAGLDCGHDFAHESYQSLAHAGLVGLLFPERLGGTNDTHVAYATAVEEIAAGCASTSLVYMTQTHAAYPILLAGSAELAGRYIPGLLDGSAYGSMAITEPDAGSDVASIATRAVPVPGKDAYLVSGAKTFITTGDRADVVVCFVTTEPSRGRDGITALVIDGDRPGLSRGRPFEKMGMHGSSTAELFLDRVEVSSANRLGAEGEGWRIVMSSVAKSRVSAAAQGVGIARTAYLRTLLVLARLHGRALPDHIASALAELRGRVLRGRLLLLATARAIDDNAASIAQIAMMKQACTDLGFSTAVAATRLLGPYGDLAEIGVERMLRDAKVTQIYDGTNEVQRLLVGRDTRKRVGEYM